MRSHQLDRRYKCDSCNYSAYQKSDLRKHIRTHTGEKPYKCDICGKAFTQTSHLSQHMVVHYKAHKSLFEITEWLIFSFITFMTLVLTSAPPQCHTFKDFCEVCYICCLFGTYQKFVLPMDRMSVCCRFFPGFIWYHSHLGEGSAYSPFQSVTWRDRVFLLPLDRMSVCCRFFPGFTRYPFIPGWSGVNGFSQTPMRTDPLPGLDLTTVRFWVQHRAASPQKRSVDPQELSC
jgi:uncharacterized C2H2 Zn-finger protein